MQALCFGTDHGVTSSNNTIEREREREGEREKYREREGCLTFQLFDTELLVCPTT